MKMVKLELLTWLRSKRMLIIFAVFLFSGFTSPLMSYYSNDIINTISNSDTKIMLQDPKWIDLIASYFKNVSQLVMFVSAYLIADVCRLGRDRSLQLYFKTRASHSGKILYPKLFVSLLMVIIGALIGGLCALYVTWVYFADFNLSRALQGLSIQLIGLLIFATISAVISFWINSPFISALIVEIFIFIAMFFDAVEDFKKWSPTSLLKPQSILTDGVSNQDFGYSLIVGVTVCLILLVISYFRPLRRKTKI